MFEFLLGTQTKPGSPSRAVCVVMLQQSQRNLLHLTKLSNCYLFAPWFTSPATLKLLVLLKYACMDSVGMKDG